MKIAVQDGKICNKTTMGDRLYIEHWCGMVWIVDETDSFRLDFIKKIESRYRSTTPDMRSVLQRKTNLGLVCSS